jgi:hypothetical protein
VLIAAHPAAPAGCRVRAAQHGPPSPSPPAAIACTHPSPTPERWLPRSRVYAAAICVRPRLWHRRRQRACPFALLCARCRRERELLLATNCQRVCVCAVLGSLAHLDLRRCTAPGCDNTAAASASLLSMANPFPPARSLNYGTISTKPCGVCVLGLRRLPPSPKQLLCALRSLPMPSKALPPQPDGLSSPSPSLARAQAHRQALLSSAVFDCACCGCPALWRQAANGRGRAAWLFPSPKSAPCVIGPSEAAHLVSP